MPHFSQLLLHTARAMGHKQPKHPHIADRRSETLDYLQAMLGQLRIMAESQRYDMLTYLIDMAYVEACDIARGQRPSAIRKDERDSNS